MKVWYVRQNNSIYGPYGSQKLKEMAINGEVSPVCEVANDRNGPWVPVEKLKGIEFPAPPPPRITPPLEIAKNEVTTQTTGTVQTIQLTSKKYKLIQLVGIGLGIPGAAISLYGIVDKSTIMIQFGVSIFVLAFLITLTGAWLAWWYHG